MNWGFLKLLNRSFWFFESWFISLSLNNNTFIIMFLHQFYCISVFITLIHDCEFTIHIKFIIIIKYFSYYTFLPDIFILFLVKHFMLDYFSIKLWYSLSCVPLWCFSLFTFLLQHSFLSKSSCLNPSSLTIFYNGRGSFFRRLWKEICNINEIFSYLVNIKGFIFIIHWLTHLQ